MADNDTPRRRRSDRGWRVLIRANAYRDIWLFVVTGLVFWALLGIQIERRHVTFTNCEAANERYVNTVAKLDELIRLSPPERKTQARRSRAGTVALIATLAPPRFDGHKDRTHPYGHSTCEAFAHRQVNIGPF
jgi:hypothetical protein